LGDAETAQALPASHSESLNERTHRPSEWYLGLMVHGSLRNLTEGSNTGPGVGDRAPAFELRRTLEEKVASSELLSTGPVLLVFYVFDFGHV
jgi:hypothetical protein